MSDLVIARASKVLKQLARQCKEILETDLSIFVDELLLARLDEDFDDSFRLLPLRDAALACEDLHLRGDAERLHRLDAVLSATLHEVFYFELAQQETPENMDKLQMKFGPFPVPTGDQATDAETRRHQRAKIHELAIAITDIAQDLTILIAKSGSEGSEATAVANGIHIVPLTSAVCTEPARTTKDRPASRSKQCATKPNKQPLMESALVYHHQFDSAECGSVMNYEPIGVGALARDLNVSKDTVSQFFKRHFGSHENYTHICTKGTSLIAKLAKMGGDKPSRERPLEIDVPAHEQSAN